MSTRSFPYRARPRALTRILTTFITKPELIMAIGNLVPWRWGTLRSLAIELPKTKQAQDRVKQIRVKAA